MDNNLYQDLPSGSSELITNLENKISELETELEHSKEALQNVFERLSEIENKIPDSAIISPKFLSRAFTVWGHYFVANLLLALPFICLSLILLLIGIAIGDI